MNMEMRGNPSLLASSLRADRKTIERNRRNHMKSLFNTLNSLIQRQNPTEVSSLPDQLDAATNYIKRLKIKIEELREKKENLTGLESLNSSIGSMVPRIYIHRTGSAIEVDLITGSSCHDHQGLFNEVMRVMNEEGAEVVSASFSAVGSNVFHTIRSEMRQHDNAGLEEGDSSLMLTTARISHRLERIGCVDYAY